MSDTTLLYIGVIVVYMIVLGMIGWFGRNKVKSCADWYVGNFQIGGIIMGVAFFATYFSAVLMIGFAGNASLWGMSATVIGMWHPVAALIAFALFAPALARMFKKLNALTFSEFLTLRFKSQALGSASSIVTSVFIIPYTVSAFIAMASVFSILIGIPFWIGVALSGGIIAVYVFSGGLFTVTIAEFIQGIVMVVAVVVIWVASYTMLGGFLPAHQALADISASAVSFPAFGSSLWATMIGLTAVMGFGMLAQPQLVIRYATICNKINLKRALVIAVLGCFIFPLAAYSYGALSRAILLPLGIDVTKINPNFIIPTFMNAAFPPWLVAIFLAGVLCAATSTIDALVHMSAGTVTRDILLPLTRGMSDKKQLNLTKVISLIVTVIACGFAVIQPGLIVQLAAYTWQVIASAFMGPIIIAIFYKRGNKIGAASGMIAGFAAAQLWYFLLAPPVTPVYPFFVGVPVSIIVAMIMSRVGKPLDEEHVRSIFP
jgi:SSS family solute:Na+ symporter